jgi:tetratricopeptide (TPR) repeat protein
MSAVALGGELGLKRRRVADGALKTAVRFWFVVTMFGQWLFAFYILSFYGSGAARGDLAAWNKVLPHGYVPGATMGNAAVVGHILFAALVNLAGALQLMPWVRSRFPTFHRWNGRVYLLAALVMAVSGFYMAWFGRALVGDASQHLVISINALLILVCGAMALRYALARDFRTHRRWAIRLFLVMSGVWFFRVGLFLSFILFRGPVGFDPKTFTGPFLTALGLAQYLLPLAVFELYLLAQERGSRAGRIAMACGLLVLTLGIGAGIAGVTSGVWMPRVKQAFDPRISIAETLGATIASAGIAQAVQQYHTLKAAGAANYNFDESELNDLGYRLIRDHHLDQAIQVLQLNVEAYPKSGNVYDSLGEAYLDAGERAQAIDNYRKALQLNPDNHGAALTLKQLGAGPQQAQ